MNTINDYETPSSSETSYQGTVTSGLTPTSPHDSERTMTSGLTNSPPSRPEGKY